MWKKEKGRDLGRGGLLWLGAHDVKLPEQEHLTELVRPDSSFLLPV